MVNDMRARNIKPGVCKNDDLAEKSPHARLLFIYLWMYADREGRFENKPKRIKAECFPYEHELVVEKLLEELSPFLEKYSNGSKEYFQIVNFSKHQNPHKNEKASDIPSIKECREITGVVQGKHKTNRADSLIEDSMIDDVVDSEENEKQQRLRETIYLNRENIIKILPHVKNVFDVEAEQCIAYYREKKIGVDPKATAINWYKRVGKNSEEQTDHRKLL